ncbi:MAG: hypothetical protein COA58_00530 [Bacteroidetes bacterium]|nr:MAG: hypothetical protein COA58_00530 [Bacteroidota bacterium]
MIFKNISLITLALTLFSLSSVAQNGDNSATLNWVITENIQTNPNITSKQILAPFYCENCDEVVTDKFLIPMYTYDFFAGNIDVESFGIKNATIKSVSNTRLHNDIEKDFKLSKSILYDQGRRMIRLQIIPIRKSGSNTEYLTDFEWDFTTIPFKNPYAQSLKTKKGQTYTSVLSSGDNYKVKITDDGVYKIDLTFLESNGIDVGSIKMSEFKIYGNGGTMLPELIATSRPEDLEEIAVYILDNNSNDQFDGDDYILWYAKGPTNYKYNATSQNFSATGHDYDIAAYYFFNWGNGLGKRVSTTPSNEGKSVNSVISQYDHLIYHEANEENHIKSGRRWWGDKMQITTVKKFNYTISGAAVGSDIAFRGVTTARQYNGSSSSMAIGIDNFNIANVSYEPVNGPYDETFAASPKTTQTTSSINSDNIELRFSYNKTQNDAAAWIDYFVLTVPRQLSIFDNQQIIRINRNNAAGNLKFDFSNFSTNHSIWNISNQGNPLLQQTYGSGTSASYIYENATLENPPMFIVFDKSSAPLPAFIGKVETQNLHGLEDIDYIMVTHSSLISEAERLAEFHRNRGLIVQIVTTEQIFNEFSSGSQDVTAIRDFVKLIYDRGNDIAKPDRINLKHLLLFGDASYDFKDVEANNTNVVPIYQSFESNFPPHSHCSDDYYAILDDGEGYWGTSVADESLDIGVGRLPVSNIDEAKIVVDKVLHYHSEESRGNWIQTVTFLADDEDGNQHLNPSEEMTIDLASQSSQFNIKKIWMDAYEQVSFGSGSKYPSVNEEITKMISSNGTLIFNYVGHGGENGMAHERVVTRPEIIKWNNYDMLSFYITASCELAKIDNLDIESPGELMLLDPDGGAMGMIATTRVVYIGTNTRLNKTLLNSNLLKTTNGRLPSLGNAYKTTRNNNSDNANSRCFILLADPAISLLSPDLKVATTHINGQEIGLFSDTLKALDLVTISGKILNRSGDLLSNFNGELFPTFYDKPSNYKTLGQDPESLIINFSEQNRIIYKGNVSVVDGKFSFQFVIPKDIAYNIAEGKLSYYAKDGLKHAGGSEYSYKIGGTSDSLEDDQVFDNLELFIDDESWVFGGTTSSTPLLLAHLHDSNGINTVGSGIGREMVAVLDAGTDYEQSFVVNDFYKPELNSYQKGKIEFPFEELSGGRHTLKLTVWDVYNNSAEAYTEFVVAEEEDIVIDNLLNYPNPFNKFTEFHFDHNKAGQNILVNLIVTSIAGNVVKSITQDIINAPSHSSDISWDGRDDYGDPIGRGVYLYTLKVRAEDGSTESKTEKLYIIN